MKKIVLSGAAAFLLAAPLLTGVVAAQNTAPAPSTAAAPSQECMQAMAAKHDAMLAQMDASFASRKQALQTFRDALKNAAALTDATERAEAMQQARDEHRASMQISREAQRASMETLRESMQEACGDMEGCPMQGQGMGKAMRGGRHGGMMGGMGKEEGGRMRGMRGQGMQQRAPQADMQIQLQ